MSMRVSHTSIFLHTHTQTHLAGAGSKAHQRARPPPPQRPSPHALQACGSRNFCGGVGDVPWERLRT